MKRKMIAVLAVLALLVLDGGAAAAAGVPTAAKSMTITEGKKKPIKVRGKLIKSKSFKSSDKKVAKVSKKGVVTAIKRGRCNVTATVKYRRSKKSKKVYTKKLKVAIIVNKSEEPSSKPSETERPTSDEGSRAADESVVRKLIEEQRERGAGETAAWEDLDNSEFYEWDAQTGRLTGISWQGCGLKGDISFRGLSALKNLSVSGNSLTGLDVSGNGNLTELLCNENNLTELNTGENKALRVLDCYTNSLEKLDVDGNVSLSELYCGRNKLVSLSVQKNKKLLSLYCDGNGLTALDVSGNQELADLKCNGNRLTELKMGDLGNLAVLHCYGNLLTSLDVSGSTKLMELHCSDNLLAELSVSKNPDLCYLYCDNNRLTGLELKGAVGLSELSCRGNLLSEIDISDCAGLQVWLTDDGVQMIRKDF